MIVIYQLKIVFTFILNMAIRPQAPNFFRKSTTPPLPCTKQVPVACVLEAVLIYYTKEILALRKTSQSLATSKL